MFEPLLPLPDLNPRLDALFSRLESFRTWVTPRTPEARAEWATQLQEFTDREIQSATTLWINRAKRPPTIADLRTGCESDLLRGSGERVLIGTPISMMDVSRGISVRVEENVQQAVTLSTGEVIMSYASKVEGKEGTQLTVPTLFGVHVPVAQNGQPYEMAVRLRYRTIGGRVTWMIKLVRPDLVLKQAVKDMVDAVNLGTQLPVVLGTAPAPTPFSVITK